MALSSSFQLKAAVARSGAARRPRVAVTVAAAAPDARSTAAAAAISLLLIASPVSAAVVPTKSASTTADALALAESLNVRARGEGSGRLQCLARQLRGLAAAPWGAVGVGGERRCKPLDPRLLAALLGLAPALALALALSPAPACARAQAHALRFASHASSASLAQATLAAKQSKKSTKVLASRGSAPPAAVAQSVESGGGFSLPSFSFSKKEVKAAKEAEGPSPLFLGMALLFSPLLIVQAVQVQTIARLAGQVLGDGDKE